MASSVAGSGGDSVRRRAIQGADRGTGAEILLWTARLIGFRVAPIAEEDDLSG